MFVARHCYFFKTYLLILWCIYEPLVEAVAPTFLVPVASTTARDVDENSPKDVSILTVEGQDGDGDTLMFSIFSQVPMSPPFELESNTGRFKTPNGLDAETAQNFTFVFSVTDGTSSVDSVPFTVIINDLNDNAPQFVGTPYTASLLDSVSNGTSVFIVSATDADVTPATITYSITGGNTGSTFTIDSNGNITVAISANLMGGSPFTLFVQAFDGANSNTTTVTITVNEDFCTPSPCENSGTCTLTGSSYNCSCSDGFIGQNCTQVDYCFGDPCVNGTCINGNTNYSCNCNPGYIGTNCSIVDYCYGGPCVNGVCINGDTNYTCNCSAGFIGVNCSQVDYCATNPCQNGGVCNNGATTHTCTCANGYTGTNCTEIVNNCVSSPCQNGGTCNNGLNFYNCTCPAGYSGTNCDKKESKPECMCCICIWLIPVVLVVILMIVVGIVLYFMEKNGKLDGAPLIGKCFSKKRQKAYEKELEHHQSPPENGCSSESPMIVKIEKSADANLDVHKEGSITDKLQEFSKKRDEVNTTNSASNGVDSSKIDNEKTPSDNIHREDQIENSAL